MNFILIMSYFQSLLLVSSIFLITTTAVQALTSFVPPGGNTPYEAYLYKGDGITIDKTTDYLPETSNHVELLQSPNLYETIGGTNFKPMDDTGIFVGYYLTDGSDPNRLANPKYGANLTLKFGVVPDPVPTIFGVNDFQVEFVLPSSVSGTIGYIGGFEQVFVPGLSVEDQGIQEALFAGFDFAFDGVGGITISPNGSFAYDSSIYTGGVEFKANFIVPEPTTVALMLGTAAALVACLRRRRHRS